MDDQLAFENQAALQLVQASLGLVSPEMRAISIELTEDRAVLHFALSATSDEVLQNISDIESEFDILAPRRLSISVVTHEAPSDGPVPHLPGRPTYRAMS